MKNQSLFAKLSIVVFLCFTFIGYAQVPLIGKYCTGLDQQKCIELDTLKTGFVPNQTPIVLKYRDKEYICEYMPKAGNYVYKDKYDAKFAVKMISYSAPSVSFMAINEDFGDVFFHESAFRSTEQIEQKEDEIIPSFDEILENAEYHFVGNNAIDVYVIKSKMDPSVLDFTFIMNKGKENEQLVLFRGEITGIDETTLFLRHSMTNSNADYLSIFLSKDVLVIDNTYFTDSISISPFLEKGATKFTAKK